MESVKNFYNSDIPRPTHIYSLDSHTDIVDYWEEIIYEGDYENSKMIYNNMVAFFEAIKAFFECGATVKVRKISKKYAKNIKKKDKIDIFNLMWTNDSIKVGYGDDFKFDIGDFGFECFEWDGNYYLCSGISA